MYILETYDKQGILHPHVGEPMRGKFLQGMFYAAAEAFPVCSAHFNLVMKEKCTDEKTVKESKDKVATVIHAHLKREVEAHKGEFYLGDKFTAVDLMFSYVLMCLEYCQGMMDDNEVVANYFKTLKCRESYAPFYTPTEEEMACCTASHEHEEKQNGAH